jgi:hypothetical protein
LPTGDLDDVRMEMQTPVLDGLGAKAGESEL